MSKRFSVLLAVVVGVLGGALVAGSVLIGASATPTTASSGAVAGPDQTKACGWRFQHLPAALRADLKAAHALPVGERRAAVRKIRVAAKAGKYGSEVQKLVEKRQQLRKALWQKMPATLRADLVKARHLPIDQRVAALKQIRKDALAGKYGMRVTRFVEHRMEQRAACRASRVRA